MDLTAGIATGDDRSRTGVRMTWQYGEKSRDMVGCIIYSENFIGEACQPTAEYWYLQAGYHIREPVVSGGIHEGTPKAGLPSPPLRGKGGDLIRPCSERFQSFLVKLSDRDGLGARADLRTE